MTRPLVRRDCVDGPRPCLHFTCRYNLSLDPETFTEADLDENGIPLSIDVLSVIDAEKGTIKRLPILCEQTRSNCALDYDDGGLSEDEVAEAMGLSTAKVRLILASIRMRFIHYKNADLLTFWQEFQSLR